MAAPNLNTGTENRRLPSNAFHAARSLPQVHPALLLNSLTASTPRISSDPSPAAQWNRTLYHGSASGEPKIGSAMTFSNSSRYVQQSNMSSGSSIAPLTVSNCSQSPPPSMPEPKCSCQQLQTTTIVVTVTATDYIKEPNTDKIGSQTLHLPLGSASAPNSALEPSMEASPIPGMLSSQILSVSIVIGSISDHYSVDQASFSQETSLQSTLFSSYQPAQNSLTGLASASKPTKQVSTLPVDAGESTAIGSESTSTALIHTDTNSSSSSRSCTRETRTFLKSNIPSVTSELHLAPSRKTSASSTTPPEIIGGSSHSTSITPPSPAPGLGNTILGQSFSGEASHSSAYSYPSNIASTSAMSYSSAGVPSQYSNMNQSLQGSLVNSYPSQLPSPQNPPQNTAASMATVNVLSFTTPSTTAVPPASSMIVLSDSSPTNHSPSVLPTTTIIPPGPIISSNPANLALPASPLNPTSPPYVNISQALNLTSLSSSTGSSPSRTRQTIFPIQGSNSAPPAWPLNPASAPYANISQALHLTTVNSSTSPSPSQTHQTMFPAQGPNSPSRPHNGSLHTITCYPNTTSTSHILANYDSPHLGHHISKFYRGLNYTSFALTNQTASMSPPTCMTSPAGSLLQSIAIASAPFLSFSLRSIALSCLQADNLAWPACTVLMVGTKVAGALPNGTSTSSQVIKSIIVTGADSGTAQRMMKVDLGGEGDGDWTGLESVSFDAKIDGKPAGLAVDDLEYDLKTKGCFFDAEW